MNFKTSKISTVVSAALGTSVLLMAASSSVAVTIPSTASVTVQNTFTMIEDTALSFGTIRASAHIVGGNHANITLGSDGSSTASTTDAANASASVIIAGAPAQFTVSGAAPFTPLTITFPTAQVDLTVPAAPPGTPDFEIETGQWEATVTTGANAGSAYSTGTPNLQTDVNGAATFTLGAVLTTDQDSPTGAYIDGLYSSSFSIEVVY